MQNGLAWTILAATVLLTTTATAQDPWWEDNVGIYSDHSVVYYSDCIQFQESGSYTCYLVLRNCSSPGGVLGWECSLELEGDGLLTGFLPYGQYIDGDSAALGFKIGLATPLPWTDAIDLMEITYFLPYDYAPLAIWIRPNRYPSLPTNTPVYVDGDDVNHLLPMYPSHSEYYPAFGVNAYCEAVETDAASWGEIRRMFR